MTTQDVLELIQHHKPFMLNCYADDRFAHVELSSDGLTLIYYTNKDKVCKRITFIEVSGQWSLELGGKLRLTQSLEEARKAILAYEVEVA